MSYMIFVIFIELFGMGVRWKFKIFYKIMNRYRRFNRLGLRSIRYVKILLVCFSVIKFFLLK